MDPPITPTKRQKMQPNKPLTSQSPRQAISYISALSNCEDSFKFDSTLLFQYHVTNMATGQRLSDLIQTIYTYANEEMQTALDSLSEGMSARVREFNSLVQQNQELQAENARLRQIQSQYTEACERLEQYDEDVIPSLQANLAKSQEQYNFLSDMVTQMETSRTETDQLQNDLASANHTIAKLRHEVDTATRGLKQSMVLFQDPVSHATYKYPVMQVNGHCTDLLSVIHAWAKTASEGDNHPHRS